MKDQIKNMEKSCCSHHNSTGEQSPHAFYCPMKCEGDKVYDQPGRCPVCNMYLVSEKENVHTKHSHNHKSVNGNNQKIDSQNKGEYYCPMQCEGDKTYPHPGECPVCGMDLVPLKIEADYEEDKTFSEMKRKFWIALALTIPVFVLAMSEMLSFLHLEKIMSGRTHGAIEFILTLPIVFYAGWSFFKRGWASVRRWSPNMWTLISFGVGAAFLFSVIALFFPSILPSQFKDELGNVHLYFEAAAVIITLVLLGQVLELKAHSKTNSALKALLDLVPPTAYKLENGIEKEVPVDTIVPGEILRVKPGNKIPVDGIITEGNAIIDESMITGEPIPVDKSIEDSVTGGTINNKSSFLMRAEKVGADTLLAQIIEMVKEAGRSRAPIQKLADIVARYFVQIVIGVALITFGIWALWGPDPAFVYAFVNAISVLIISCPCALGLATPVSIMVGTGRGAQSGILVKDARSIEEMNKIDTLIIDKTGTITEGKPSLEAYVSTGILTDNEILAMAASVNIHSEHPVGESVVKAAEDKNLELVPVKDFESVLGKGVIASLNGDILGVGNLKLVEDYNLKLNEHQQKLYETWQSEGKTVIFLFYGRSIDGMLCVTDKIKDSSFEAISSLQKLGMEVIMLTGDNQETAKTVAEKLRLDDFYAECLPEEKFTRVQELQQKGKKVAMAGDGINDAPALAQADIGIAMGTGTDIAMQSAEITLVKGDLRGIVRARELSFKVMRNIKQNLFFAFIYNALGVPIAAGILFPFFGILLSPLIAAAAMSFSSVSVITNALRLRNA